VIGEHVLAGYAPEQGAREALALARGIVAVTGGRLTVATVHTPDRPAAAGEALALLEQAADLAPEAETAAQEGRGVGRGLSVLASRIGADLIVIGSAGGGARGRIVIGSTADNLLHSAPEAVMIAPSGYSPPEWVERITVAYVSRPQCDEAVLRAADAAARLNAGLRLLTLAIDDAPRERLRDDLALALRLPAEVSGDLETEARLAEGDDVADAVERTDWKDGEILVCASSEDASAHRVFLGEIALKLLRAAPCPVTVLPRGYS
jgi:nucleotide-binding universal stress UspA family protein